VGEIMDNGNQPQFRKVFAHDLYSSYISEHQCLQRYWNSPMFLRKRRSDGYLEVCSNIHIGDFFGCGTTAQVGIVCQKALVLQGTLKPEYQKPSPAGQGGNYLKYDINGDIGGHLRHPTHDDFTKGSYFLWLPTPLRLEFAGFVNQAKVLREIMSHIVGFSHPTTKTSPKSI
jgi:hypothetical protein